MFEDELEMEKKEGGGWGVVLMIILLAGVIVGGIGYVIWQNQQMLKPEEAAAAITASMTGHSSTHFKTGHIVPSVADQPDAPNYRLLEKAGMVKRNKAKNGAVDIVLTDTAKSILTMPELQKTTDKDGNVAYEVPLASKKLVQVGRIKKINPTRFVVEYTWQWEPNKLGDVFDVASKNVQGFSTYERSVLIDKFGADYYHPNEPAKALVYVVKTDKGWKTSAE